MCENKDDDDDDDFNEHRDNGIRGWQWDWWDHIQAICTSLQTDNYTNTSSLNF